MRDWVTGRFRMAFAVLLVVACAVPTAWPQTPADGTHSGLPVVLAQAVPDTASRPAVPIVEAPADSDTVRVPLRSVRRGRTERKTPNVAWTTIRSGILPGWGQLANGKPLKAVLLGGIYTGWAVGAWMAETDRRDLKERLEANPDDPVLVQGLNEAVNRRNFRMWMMGATTLYAMIDAYVDVHFLDYEETWSAGFRPDAPALAVTVRF